MTTYEGHIGDGHYREMRSGKAAYDLAHRIAAKGHRVSVVRVEYGKPSRTVLRLSPYHANPLSTETKEGLKIGAGAAAGFILAPIVIGVIGGLFVIGAIALSGKS